MNPLAEDYAPSPTDERLVALAVAGDPSAASEVVRRHQRWIYNLALRVLQSPADAADATQESLIKVLTHLSSFRGESAFRTWCYGVALRHLLDRRRSRAEEAVHGFACFSGYLRALPDEELAADEPSAEQPDTRLLVEEAKLTCMMGMLLCLDRVQRVVFLLGDVFEVTDSLASAILDIKRDAYRQQLFRARQQLQSFMRDQCGLMDPKNPCRCARKTRGFMRNGVVDPARLVFQDAEVDRVRDVCRNSKAELEALVGEAHARLFRDHPFYEGPDMVARLRLVMNDERLRSTLNLT